MWGVPRTGMIYCRHGETLVWVATFPPDSLYGAETIELAREVEFAQACEEFGKAGVKLGRVVTPMPFPTLDAALTYIRDHQPELTEVPLQ